MPFTPELCHAGRILARINRKVLADESGIDAERIREFEEGAGDIGDTSLDKLKAALEALGVIFLPEEDESGVGIRLKFTGSENRRILNWEGEGGRARSDNVV